MKHLAPDTVEGVRGQVIVFSRRTASATASAGYFPANVQMYGSPSSSAQWTSTDFAFAGIR